MKYDIGLSTVAREVGNGRDVGYARLHRALSKRFGTDDICGLGYSTT